MLAKQKKLVFVASVVFLLISILMASWGFPKIVSKQIQKNIQISNDSQMFEKFVKTPMPLDFKIYVFTVTNREEVNQGQKPILKEVGPFVYKEYRDKTILGYGPNDTIKYMLNKRFVFDKAASGGLSDDEEITVINFPYMGAVLSAYDLMPSLIGMINKALEEFFSNLVDPFMTVKAKDLFFDGIFLNCNGTTSALGLVCGRIKADKPATMRQAEDANGFYFSFFNHMNSSSGPFEMIRGTENIQDLGNIVSYNGKTAMSVWGDKYCGMINGSDSTVFPPIVEGQEPQRLYIFEPDVCRSMYASLVGKRTFFNMPAYYYELDESVLAAKSANPNNRCYCRSNWSSNHDGCLMMGLLNLMPCQGAPAIASLPHFYLASEEILEYFGSGVSPDREKHNNFVYLDPVTGVVLKGVRRLQFNIELRNLPGVPQLQNVSTGLFPLLWIDEGAELPEDLQDELRQSHKLISYVGVARWALLVIAIIGCIVAGALYAKAAAIWPNKNSVSFMMRPGTQDSKGFH